MAGGVRAERTLESYEELAAALSADPGAVALVPAEMVDFRVQALTVGEDDPLDKIVGGQAPVRIGVVGDIVPGRNVHLHMLEYGDFTRPFQRVAPLLRSFDVTVANLEGNLSETLPQPADPHSVSFVSSPAMLEGFALAGIDAVTLANNHSVWNDEGWGVQGLLDTIAALDSHGIPYFGAGPTLAAARAPWVVAAGGTRIAFLGIDAVTANYEVEPGAATGVLDVDVGATDDSAGTNPYLAAQVAEDIAAATAIADVVIPYFHLGAEYVAVVPPWAVQAAHAAIDAGAAMVVTNHPHLNPGHGDLRRQADRLLTGELHPRSDVGGGGAVGLRAGDHSPRHGDRRAALPWRRDRGFPSATSDVIGRAGGADGPLLGGDGSPGRARRDRGSVLIPGGTGGAPFLNLAQRCLGGGDGCATALEPLLSPEQPCFIAGERGHRLGETLLCLCAPILSSCSSASAPAASSFAVRLCMSGSWVLVAMRSFRGIGAC